MRAGGEGCRDWHGLCICLEVRIEPQRCLHAPSAVYCGHGVYERRHFDHCTTCPPLANARAVAGNPEITGTTRPVQDSFLDSHALALAPKLGEVLTSRSVTGPDVVRHTVEISVRTGLGRAMDVYG